MTRPTLLLGGLALALALHGCAGLPAPSGSIRAEAKATQKAGDDRPGVEGSVVFECHFGSGPAKPPG